MKKSWKTLPQMLLSRLKIIIPAHKYEEVLRSFSYKKPTTFRINTLKTDRNNLLEILATEEIRVKPVSWNKDAYILKDASLGELAKTESYKNGCLYVQSLSSMIPALILNPKSGEKVLDITAAPGSKTTQMAAMMGNKGEIVANDISLLRLYRLDANLKNQGVGIAKKEKMDARNIWQKYPEYFDKTLADVPCSMEGRIFLNEPKSYLNWSLKRIKNLSKLQKWILRSAVSATKPGGRIVYSTCTLSPEENEEVIDWIMKKEAGSLELEKESLKGLDFFPGLKNWNGQDYIPGIIQTGRIIPSQFLEGFFIASIRKIRSNIRY